ncbi:VOC family protein [Edaphobacter aggregans]|uniref:VOC family protein n=1 Tax=Edaphobacter aggregans TaxID=570835 RepID=UPI001C8CAC3F|nr:VOC family protein [Edaphobacter aggregans]
MALKRLDNIGIVVDNLELTIDFFQELGLQLEGRTTIEGEWAGRVTGLADQRVEIAMMRTPDGHSLSSCPASSRRLSSRITATLR